MFDMRRILTVVTLLALGLLGPRPFVVQPAIGPDLVAFVGVICGQPDGGAPGSGRDGHCPACVPVVSAVLPARIVLPKRVPDVRVMPFGVLPRLVLPPRYHPCPHGCGPPQGAVFVA